MEKMTPVHHQAAGIDVGAAEHWVAVPAECDQEPVRRFGAFSCDLRAIADWLKACGVTTVAMESTGVYWIALFELLETRGFDVKLVDARAVHHVPGRKSDALDCQWIQQLHTYGLLSGAFRPADDVCKLRVYLRQRSMLVEHAAQHVQHMQKALTQMNLKLQHVVSDITGVTGMAIITAIVQGEHDPSILAKHRHPRCVRSEQDIAKALDGSYREEHLFALRQAFELYRTYRQQIQVCEDQIDTCMAKMDKKLQGAPTDDADYRRKRKGRIQKNSVRFDARGHLYRITGVDLTRIDGIDATTALKLIAEIGTDMTRWPSVKHFSSWLALCPGLKKSGGRMISSRTKPSANRAAAALRMAAQTLLRSKSALGAYYRRMRTRLGAPKAVTAAAHKLARLVYSMLRYGQEYVDSGEKHYEQQYRARVVRNLTRRARDLGLKVIPINDLGPAINAPTTAAEDCG
ncbi:MAG: IS110 family transposase [Candidatus Nealsonbacteria bacterium]|nr:IS110 family transposase [Candidatus Nealsonbacteria bacterium]